MISLISMPSCGCSPRYAGRYANRGLSRRSVRLTSCLTRGVCVPVSSKSRQRGRRGQQRGTPEGASSRDTRPRPPMSGNQPAGGDEISKIMQFLQSQPQLIVCGRLGLQPLSDTQRRELFSSVDLFDALETVARLQGRWDIAYTTTQRADLVEADFLASATGEACRRARKRVVTHRDFLVSPRATAQLQREIIEFASADEAAPPIDLNTLVHMLLSITSEQNMRPEFAGDVPTDAEVAKL